MRAAAVRSVVDILVIKARIEHYYKQEAHSKSELQAYKRERGFCGGRPFCMNALNPSQRFKLCKECREAERSAHASERPKTQSRYGAMRARERATEKRTPKKSHRRKAA